MTSSSLRSPNILYALNLVDELCVGDIGLALEPLLEHCLKELLHLSAVAAGLESAAPKHGGTRKRSR